MKYEIIANFHCYCGENPLWDNKNNVLYWTDIYTGRLFKWDETKQIGIKIYEGEIIGGFTIQENGDLLLFRQSDIALFSVKNNQIIKTFALDFNPKFERFNDVISDSEGRIFAGVMSSNKSNGGFYKISKDLKFTRAGRNSQISNGFAFNKANNKLFWVNTSDKIIYIFDYQKETGSITNQQVFYSYVDENFVPDGITIDSADNLFVAKWDGYGIDIISMESKIINSINLPVKKITSITFGGKNLDKLFVTSAGFKPENLNTTDYLDGCTFSIDTEYTGKTEFRSKAIFY
jgi:D-xylonolactonase